MMDASPYLSRHARTLHEVCHETGREKDAEPMAERR
jgi:hypothetical protein